MDLPLPDPSLDRAEQARLDRRRFRTALLASAAFVALLWWLRMLEVGLGLPLEGLGVRPGHWSGLIGVLTGPLVHGSTRHLVGNTLPLLVLGTLTLAVYPRSAGRALALIWLASGLGLWWIGRPSLHIGASGLTHGLMFFLFALGLLRRDRPAVGAMLIAFFLYGGMLLTVLPGDPQVSWEAHLCGALAGLAAALLWRRRDPAPPRKRYSWEDETIEPLEAPLAAQERATLEPPAPHDVPVLWAGPRAEPRGVVLAFPPRAPRAAPEDAPP